MVCVVSNFWGLMRFCSWLAGWVRTLSLGSSLLTGRIFLNVIITNDVGDKPQCLERSFHKRLVNFQCVLTTIESTSLRKKNIAHCWCMMKWVLLLGYYHSVGKKMLLRLQTLWIIQWKMAVSGAALIAHWYGIHHCAPSAHRGSPWQEFWITVMLAR